MNSASVKEKQARDFARYLIEGKTQTEAYRLTHPDNVASDDSLKQLASRYAKRSSVKKIIEETKTSLKEHTEKKFNVSKEKIMSKLSEMAFEDNQVRHSDKLKAMEMLNKMLGYNESEKLDVDIEGQLSVNFEGQLDEWSK